MHKTEEGSILGEVCVSSNNEALSKRSQKDQKSEKATIIFHDSGPITIGEPPAPSLDNRDPNDPLWVEDEARNKTQYNFRGTYLANGAELEKAGINRWCT